MWWVGSNDNLPKGYRFSESAFKENPKKRIIWQSQAAFLFFPIATLLMEDPKFILPTVTTMTIMRRRGIVLVGLFRPFLDIPVTSLSYVIRPNIITFYRFRPSSACFNHWFSPHSDSSVHINGYAKFALFCQSTKQIHLFSCFGAMISPKLFLVRIDGIDASARCSCNLTFLQM